jgi:hypothetical protein
MLFTILDMQWSYAERKKGRNCTERRRYQNFFICVFTVDSYILSTGSFILFISFVFSSLPSEKSTKDRLLLPIKRRLRGGPHMVHWTLNKKSKFNKSTEKNFLQQG